MEKFLYRFNGHLPSRLLAQLDELKVRLRRKRLEALILEIEPGVQAEGARQT